MRYKHLGKSGLRVSELCLGGMTFGEDWGSMLPGASKEEAKKIFDLFVSKGGNFIDTANVYQNGTSEKYVAHFIRFLARTVFVDSLAINSRTTGIAGHTRCILGLQ
jgi:aryl-alcohol dehydrogenase-like predicted oxidoreductase